MSWNVTTAQSKRSVIHWPEIEDGTPFAKVRGGNPLLFPFAGRSFDRGKENTWIAPDGKQRPMPRHGFARDGQFTVDQANDQSLHATLVPKEADLQAYPFAFRFTVSYFFDDLSFTVTLSLHNTGPEPIPWSAGHHFYFTVPWHPAARREDYRILMEPRKAAVQGPDGRLTSQVLRETRFSMADPSLIDRIQYELRHSRIAFGPKSGEEDVVIRVAENDPPPKNMALLTWTESPESPFYCVEPWMGPPNAAEHGKGLHWVGPGQSESFTVQVSLY
jgi:galactose mutarotase-like enzyme